jgi:hypothetical protein
MHVHGGYPYMGMGGFMPSMYGMMPMQVVPNPYQMLAGSHSHAHSRATAQ